MEEQKYIRAGFVRRFAAIIYDSLIAVAVGLLSAIIVTAVITGLLENDILSKGNYEHVNDLIQNSVYYQAVIQVWVGIWVACFFLYFWKHGGQTLGMRAWRLRLYRLHDDDDKPITYGRLLLRLLASLGGLGTLLVLFDFKNKLALQDRVSSIQMLVLTKEQNHHKNW